MILTMPTRGGG